jgi:hypothetical protein
MSEESRRKMSVARTGKVWSPHRHERARDVWRRRKAGIRLTPLDIRRNAWACAMWKEYRLTPHEIALLLDAQDRTCPLCSTSLEEKWHIDHCHRTHRVRGALCPGCNLLLGVFEKRFDAERTLAYLAREGAPLAPDATATVRNLRRAA